MALLPLKTVRLPKAAEQFFDGWLADLQAQLAEPKANWALRLREPARRGIYLLSRKDRDGLDPLVVALTASA